MATPERTIAFHEKAQAFSERMAPPSKPTGKYHDAAGRVWRVNMQTDSRPDMFEVRNIKRGETPYARLEHSYPVQLVRLRRESVIDMGSFALDCTFVIDSEITTQPYRRPPSNLNYGSYFTVLTRMLIQPVHNFEPGTPRHERQTTGPSRIAWPHDQSETSWYVPVEIDGITIPDKRCVTEQSDSEIMEAWVDHLPHILDASGH